MTWLMFAMGWLAGIATAWAVACRSLRAVRRIAYRDVVTGLPNRNALLAAAPAFLRSVSEARPGAVALVDLDGFKQVNDARGHAFGDLALAAVAGELVAAVGGRGTVYRIGGDEFVVISSYMSVSEVLAATPLDFGLSMSIGVCLVSDPGLSVSRALGNADAAMYEAKRSGQRVLVSRRS